MKMPRWLIWILVVMTVSIVGVTYNSQRNSQNIDQLDSNVTELQTGVKELQDFVHELQEETPDEQAQNAAVSEAVRLVPEIKMILCEQFPNASACKEG